MTLELYSERTTRRPADISLSVFLFLNYLSTDREFYPLEGVFRAEYKFRFKPLHTLHEYAKFQKTNRAGGDGALGALRYI